MKRSLSSLLAVPSAPVSEMVGKYCAFAAPICALAAMSVCSACSEVRPALEELRGQAGGHARKRERVERLAARDRAGVAAEQDRQRVLGLRDLVLDQRDLRRGRLVLRARLLDVHLRDLAVLVLQLEQLDRLAVGRRACASRSRAARRGRGAAGRSRRPRRPATAPRRAAPRRWRAAWRAPTR